ncbi:MAG TPA: ABC transporter permease [Kouleothrix sp.]|uniref:ABC transporter permease n=1 Tax=Kouleothrix sp. TaxID=2779161 RepID=UPI002C1235A4|nr:ABC transporter permease [Kouleothrix sp.]HRC76519.1 ABC transporter permease [Kouleothrix sp.]
MTTDTAPISEARQQALSKAINRSERGRLFALLFPGLFWLSVFFAFPLFVILLYSFLTPGPTGNVIWKFTLGNYATLFTKDLYVNAYVRSLWIGVMTTVVCLLIGYPLALYIVQRSPRWRNVLLFLVLIPFWTNFLVRTYAWMIILANNGVINSLLQSIGMPRLTLLNTTGAVLVGLIYGELPFMVLPIYASIDRFDFTLLEAASDLGADRRRAFLRIMLPLTMPGVAAGSVLVFIPTVGQFVVSDLLGGAKVDMLGNLLQRLFTRSNPPNWPLGSAMALIFMLVLTIAIIFYFRTTTEEDR